MVSVWNATLDRNRLIFCFVDYATDLEARDIFLLRCLYLPTKALNIWEYLWSVLCSHIYLRCFARFSYHFYNFKNMKNTQPATLLKGTLPYGCFSVFLSCTDGAKARKASHMLIHFRPLFNFYTPWKRRENLWFFIFSWDIEMGHWCKMG